MGSDLCATWRIVCVYVYVDVGCRAVGVGVERWKLGRGSREVVGETQLL